VSRQRLGQHFLKEDSVLERIAQLACPDGGSPVIEIGPGRGALTTHLLERSERVIAIEIDPALAAFLREKFQDKPHFTLIEADAREIDLRQWGPASVTGNLPYYAATPIIEKTLAPGAPWLQRAVFMVQKEVAQRLAARPHSRDYGYLSVQTQLFAGVELVFDVPPSAFEPPPKVQSSVVRLTPHNRAAELGIGDTTRFLSFVGQCFRQKRRTLRNNLAGVFGKAALEGLPEAARRAEELTLDRFAHLFRVLYLLPGGQSNDASGSPGTGGISVQDPRPGT